MEGVVIGACVLVRTREIAATFQERKCAGSLSDTRLLLPALGWPLALGAAIGEGPGHVGRTGCSPSWLSRCIQGMVIEVLQLLLAYSGHRSHETSHQTS